MTSGPGPSPALEGTIARILTVGTAVSVALLAAGVLVLIAGGTSPLAGGPAFDPGRLVADLVALRPEGFLWLGLVAVVATPTGRVLAALLGYARTGERAMAGVAALILVVIAASVALAQTPGA